jgi:hypothetical protein
MHPTCFIYSSHNRCEYIHRWWIVERALKSPDNKTLLYLPMSENSDGGAFGSAQQFGWGKFEWYLDRFKQWGLQSNPFYYSSTMTRHDAEVFVDMVANYEVVILGGGNSSLGLERYKGIGQHFFGDRDLFEKILHDRARRGKLTVGFSAGADQLGAILSSQVWTDLADPVGFGLAHNIMTTLHHDPSQNRELFAGAQKFPHCMIFGLPNDSGLAVSQGTLPSGNIWQIIEFVTDNSWDIPEEAFHIKTRAGAGIDHFYADGRSWSFQGGDRMARVMSPDSSWQDAFVITTQGRIIHYYTYNECNFGSIEEIFSHF